MSEIEIGYCVVGLISLVSLIGMISIISDMIFNRERKEVTIKRKETSVDWAEFVKD
jgi:hypothetical protein